MSSSNPFGEDEPAAGSNPFGDEPVAEPAQDGAANPFGEEEEEEAAEAKEEETTTPSVRFSAESPTVVEFERAEGEPHGPDLPTGPPPPPPPRASSAGSAAEAALDGETASGGRDAPDADAASRVSTAQATPAVAAAVAAAAAAGGGAGSAGGESTGGSGGGGGEEDEYSSEEDEERFAHAGVSISQERLGDVLRTIERTRWGKISAVSAFLRSTSSCNFFTCDQLRLIIRTCTFSEERVDAIRVCAPKIIDRENIEVVLSILKGRKEKKALCEAFELNEEAVFGQDGAGAESDSGDDDGVLYDDSSDEEDAAEAEQAGEELQAAATAAAKAKAAPSSKDEDEAKKRKARPRRPKVVNPDEDRVKEVLIFVTDAEQIGSGMGSHVSYKVTCQTNLVQYSNERTFVRRRYKDFVWLHQQLAYYHPGHIVASLPPAKVSGRFQATFIEKRRRALELFLNRAGSHPILSRSDALQQFLEADDEQWAQVLKSSKAELKADKKTDDRSSAAGSTKISSSIAAIDMDHDSYEQVLKYINDFGEQLNVLKKQSKALSKHHLLTADMVRKLGGALEETAVREQDDDLTDTLRSFGAQYRSGLATLHELQAETEKIKFKDPLQEYLLLIEGVRELMKNRLGALKELYKVTESLEKSKGLVAKQREKVAKKNDEKNASKLKKMEEALEDESRLVDLRRTEFERLSKSFFVEIGRFNVEKRMDLRDILIDYVKSQMDLASKMQSVWRQSLPAIKKLPRWYAFDEVAISDDVSGPNSGRPVPDPTSSA